MDTEFQEIFENLNGTGQLEVRSFQGADGLFVKGLAAVLHWPDCAGSVGQEFFVFPGTTIERDEALRAIVRDARSAPEPLGAALAPLLGQLTPGSYQLRLEQIASEWALHQREPGWFAQGNIFGYYPLDVNYHDQVNLIATQPASASSPETVTDWTNAIESGMRPFALTLRSDCESDLVEFVLDGHHKLAAYAQLGIAPWRLAIAPCFPPAAINSSDWPKEYVPEPTYAWKWIFR
jgi:hypothetical protein